MNDRGLQTETDATRTGVIVFLFEHRQTVCSQLSERTNACDNLTLVLPKPAADA